MKENHAAFYEAVKCNRENDDENFKALFSVGGALIGAVITATAMTASRKKKKRADTE